MQKETQFFLSSAVAEDVSPGHSRFSVTLEPPMKIQGKSARMFVHSATIPYTFPNITASNNTLVCDVGATSVALTIPIGVYSLADLQNAINEQVNAHMHTQGLALLVDGAGKANFIAFTPNARLNRVEATFAHLGTGIDCSQATSTMRTVLGFTALIGYAEPTITVSDAAPLSFAVSVNTDGGTSNVTVSASNGVHAASVLLAEVNNAVKTLTSGTIPTLLTSLTVVGAGLRFFFRRQHPPVESEQSPCD